jgi:hypothetical protein
VNPLLHLRGKPPKVLVVFDLCEPDARPRNQFAITADYGWAERIVAIGMSKDDANDVARVMAEKIGCRAELA